MEQINKFIDSHFFLLFSLLFFNFLSLYLSLSFSNKQTHAHPFAVVDFNISRAAASDIVTHKSQNTRPEFQSLLSDVYVGVGRHIEIDCALIGEPMPTVFWKFNGTPITNCDRIKVSNIHILWIKAKFKL